MTKFTTAHLVAILDRVTVADMATVEKQIANVGGLTGALGAYVKTGRKNHATLGALAYVYQGILETLQHGQKSKLQGFALASKRQSPEYRILQDMGILSDTGQVLAGVDGSFTKDLQDRALQFVTAVTTAAAAIRAAAAEQRAAEKAEKEAEKASNETDVSVSIPAGTADLSDGQRDDAAVAWIVSRAEKLSTENVLQLQAMIDHLQGMAQATAKKATAKKATAKKATAKKATATV